MKIKIILLVFLLSLSVSCRQQAVEEIAFIKDGKTSELQLHNMQMKSGKYLQSDKGFSLKAEKAIYGDEISTDLKMSVNDLRGVVVVTVGDNSLELVNESDEKSFSLKGPSIGRYVSLGEMGNLIKPNVPFELSVSYKNETLTYSLNGKELYSGNTVIAPGGVITIGGEDADLRVYYLVCKGRFKPLETFYTKIFLLDRAEKSTAIAAEKVKGDPNRPVYHFLPPANWNNDPNGLLFYNGYYHLFYQYNPYGDRWDWMHWGHARSRDLVHWEYMPIALWPSKAKREDHCFSGSGFIKEDGKPILIYTSIGHKNPEVWAANPEDDSLFGWEKNPADPILVMKDHRGKIIDDWRDPYVFRDNGETYMVVGGHPRNGKGSIMLYKDLNADLTKWEFLGIPFSSKDENWECPNFFKIGNKYVLVYSPQGRVKYFTGSMDFKNIKFTPEYHGDVDDGQNFYAPNTIQKAGGRRVLFGWIPGFKENQGWQGAITLPRDLSIDNTGRLIQKPVPELEKLRGALTAEKNVNLSGSSKKLDIDYPQFEMKAAIADSGTDEIGFRFNKENDEPYEIKITSQSLFFDKEKVAASAPLNEKIKNVRLFFDRTVIEIFVNGGKICAIKVVYPDKKNLNFEIFGSSGSLSFKELNIWKLKSIW
jgi:beta-fructofuranosidase